jgi:hypothetical protein
VLTVLSGSHVTRGGWVALLLPLKCSHGRNRLGSIIYSFVHSTVMDRIWSMGFGG